MMILRVNGAAGVLRSNNALGTVQGSVQVQGGERGNFEHGTLNPFGKPRADLNCSALAEISGRQRKSPPALRAERLRAGHTCNRLASCPCAICETEPCDGSGCPACGRKQLRRPVRDAAAPKTSPSPGSS